MVTDYYMRTVTNKPNYWVIIEPINTTEIDGVDMKWRVKERGHFAEKNHLFPHEEAARKFAYDLMKKNA